jgi:hypothetical protein
VDELVVPILGVPDEAGVEVEQELEGVAERVAVVVEAVQKAIEVGEECPVLGVAPPLVRGAPAHVHHLGFGRIVASEIEVPIFLVNLV